MNYRKIASPALLLLTAALVLGMALPALAQDPQNTAPAGWRRVDDPPPQADSTPPPADPNADLPPELVMPAGTWVTIRVNDALSSDRNQEGDTFTGTLAQPLVVDGFVVARRGQTVAGRVTETQKAGRVRGTSRLGVELTEITLVDGRQVPLSSQLVQASGGTSVGSDAVAVGTATGVGAAIGAAADGGFGAGMGAIAGAGASAIGVLLTRGRATEIYPESVLTFRTQSPVNIDTTRGAIAFEPVRQQDYEPQAATRRPTTARNRRPTLYPGYPGGWGWGWPYSPYYGGYDLWYYSRPTIVFGTGWGRGFGGRGFHGGRRRR